MPVRPALIVEGLGDTAAVPFLIRRVRDSLGLYEVNAAPNPIQVGDPLCLNRIEHLEKIVRYAALNPDADSVFIAVDFDVFEQSCPVEIAKGWSQRIAAIQTLNKPVAICFFIREYEGLILASMSDVVKAYPHLNWMPDAATDHPNIELVRGAKEFIGRLINGGTYRASIDQAKFTSALDLNKLQKVRCFQRFGSAIEWLYNWTPDTPRCSPI